MMFRGLYMDGYGRFPRYGKEAHFIKSKNERY